MRLSEDCTAASDQKSCRTPGSNACELRSTSSLRRLSRMTRVIQRHPSRACYARSNGLDRSQRRMRRRSKYLQDDEVTSAIGQHLHVFIKAWELERVTHARLRDLALRTSPRAADAASLVSSSTPCVDAGRLEIRVTQERRYSRVTKLDLTAHRSIVGRHLSRCRTSKSAATEAVTTGRFR